MSESDEIKTDHFSSSDEDEPVTEEHRAILKAEKAAALRNPLGKNGGVAYQILLLQQRLEIGEGGSPGTASPNSSSDTHYPQPGSFIGTPPRAKLSREEPEAVIPRIRVCEG